MAKGLTLEELAASTKISLKILRAMETGDFEVLPQTYIKGFLRTYAQEAGLDAVSIVKAYEEQKKAAADIFLHPTRTEKKAKRRFSWVFWGILVGVCLILFAGYYVLSGLAPKQRYVQETTVVDTNPMPSQEGEAVQPETNVGDSMVTTDQGEGSAEEPVEKAEEPVVHAEEPVVEIQEPVEKEQEPEVFDRVQELGPPPPPVSESDPFQVGNESEAGLGSEPVALTLTAEAVSDTWMRVLADGIGVYEGILRVQSSAAWKADSLFELKIGKAAGIRLLLNGQSLGVLGSPEQVVSELILDKNGIVKKRLR